MSGYKKTLFVFRRDLRLRDNTGLFAAMKDSDQVLACFIFDPRQYGADNEYKSMNCLQFMVESLEDLAGQLAGQGGRLYFFEGIAECVIERIVIKEKVEAVFFNRDYTPFSQKRDEAIAKICAQHQIVCGAFHDALLHDPELVKKQDNAPYSLFTAFYKKALKYPVAEPKRLPRLNFYTNAISGSVMQKKLFAQVVSARNEHIAVYGGSGRGMQILKNLKKFRDYGSTRDIPSIDTTHLSAHHKFGTVSIRQTYSAIVRQLGAHHLLLRQLYWRDFFTYITYHSPFVFGAPYYEKYAKLPWENNKADFAAWCDGQTGCPIVDAGMRQLNKTGFMHNRVRMIVATFLIKDLHIDWLWGENYFAQKLVDYDPAVNNGNWQWCAGVGATAQPYFRIFNPALQQKKWDPDCTYVKRWVDELCDVDSKTIFQLYTGRAEVSAYPAIIVDHAQESKKAKLMYTSIR